MILFAVITIVFIAECVMAALFFLLEQIWAAVFRLTIRRRKLRVDFYVSRIDYGG
jgi:hypothetical protein